MRAAGMRGAAIAVSLLLLAGCVSDMEAAGTVQSEARSGHCDPADIYANANISDPGLRAFEHAVVANVCRKNQASSLGYLVLGARWGSSDARASLTKMRQPIPAADLREAEDRRSDARAATMLMLLEAGVSGYNQGGYNRPSAPVVSTSCTTTNGITNCLSF